MPDARPSQSDFADQSRWNETAKPVLEDIRKRPAKYKVRKAPTDRMGITAPIATIIGDYRDRELLELGCGRGNHAVYLANQGARVTGVDIGEDLVAVSAAVAEANEVKARFEQADIRKLPFQPHSFDAAIGLAILHHLPPEGVRQAFAEAARVLRADGVAIFYEPVENSPVFDFLQNLIPAGRKGTPFYRPSLLNRRAWAAYQASLDDRAMSNAELISASGDFFQEVELLPFGLTIRLERLIGTRFRARLRALDQWLLARAPFLRKFSQTVLVVCRTPVS